MSADDLYEDPVWWRREELEEYFYELYGQEEGEELYNEVLGYLDDAAMRDGDEQWVKVWGRERRPILGQMEMDNHLEYDIEDEEALFDRVYRGDRETFAAEAGHGQRS
ncbi:MAG: hypothetical protein SV186_00645 [Candidatus Nanohaloarchaea archaeon]|nr:hypothetical protein [Candidatus Nanohaloarchaea archaeon]